MDKSQALALGDGDPERALRLTGAVFPYWAIRGHWTGGRRSFEAALAMVKDWKLELTEDPLWVATIFAHWQGDEETALGHATHLLDLARSQDSSRGQAIALQMIAAATSVRGDFDHARELYEESLVLAREADDEWLITVVLNNLGGAEVEAGNVERGIELFEESLALGEERGDIERRARQLTNPGSRGSSLATDRRLTHFSPMLSTGRRPSAFLTTTSSSFSALVPHP